MKQHVTTDKEAYEYVINNADNLSNTEIEKYAEIVIDQCSYDNDFDLEYVDKFIRNVRRGNCAALIVHASFSESGVRKYAEYVTPAVASRLERICCSLSAPPQAIKEIAIARFPYTDRLEYWRAIIRTGVQSEIDEVARNYGLPTHKCEK